MTVDEDAIRSKTQANQPYNLNSPPMKPIAFQVYPKTLYLWPKDKTLHPVCPRTPAHDRDGNLVFDRDGKVVMETDFSKVDARRVKVAKDEGEEKKLLAKGFRTEPHVQEFPDEKLTADEFEIDAPKASKAV